jgi:hypothetical protein
MSHAQQQRARDLVGEYVLAHMEKTDPPTDFDVYVVWFCYILGNWKALLSTTLPDGMYYEVTHNNFGQETYIDAYKKFDNVAVPDE